MKHGIEYADLDGSDMTEENIIQFVLEYVGDTEQMYFNEEKVRRFLRDFDVYDSQGTRGKQAQSFFPS